MLFRTMLILILFGAAISLPSASLTELSQHAIHQLHVNGMKEHEKVKAHIAEQGPENAAKIHDLLALLETIDFGCEKTAPEDFANPYAISPDCHNMKWFWEHIFFNLGLFESMKPTGWPEERNFDKIEEVIGKVKQDPGWAVTGTDQLHRMPIYE